MGVVFARGLCRSCPRIAPADGAIKAEEGRPTAVCAAGIARASRVAIEAGGAVPAVSGINDVVLRVLKRIGRYHGGGRPFDGVVSQAQSGQGQGASG